jgi:predicted GH43/DUF377 family glycosyl hydrolase
VRERGLLLARRVARWASDSGDADLAGQAHMVVAEALQAGRQPTLVAEAVEQAERVAPSGSVAAAHALFFRAGFSAATNRDRGRYELAQRAADQLADVAFRQHEPPLQGLYIHLLATALHTVANQATAAGEWEVAERALAAAGRVDTARWAADWGDWSQHVLLARAALLFAQQRYAEAVAGLRAAVQRAEELGNRAWVTGGRARLGIALCYAGQEEEEGLAEVEAGLRMERDVLSSPAGVAGQLRALGEYYLEHGRWLDAAELFVLAEPLYQELGHIDATLTATLLQRARDGYGPVAFDAWRSAFRPERSRWAQYALLWGLGRFDWRPGAAVMPQAHGNHAQVRAAAAVLDDGAVNLLFEVVSGEPPASAVQRAISTDGITVTRTTERPVLTPSEPWEQPGGCRNPRATRVGERFVLAYAAGDPPVPATASGADPDRWTRNGPVFPEGLPAPVQAAEPTAQTLFAAVLLGEPVDGRWWMYFGADQIWAAWTEDASLRGWRLVHRPVLSPRPGRFDGRLVAPGPPPVWLPEGIVLLYNGVDESSRHFVGQVLLAPTDPTRVLRRSPVPLLSTDAPPGPVAAGLVQHDGAWLLYCATGGPTIGVAATTYPGRP